TYIGQLGRRMLRSEDIGGPNPNIPGTLQLILNRDTSDYHALQIQYRKFLSSRLRVLASYTWSHSIDTNSSDSSDGVFPLASAAPTDRGSSPFELRHNLSSAIAYALPGLVRESPLARVLNNWSLNLVAQVRSGFPVNVVLPNNALQIAGVLPPLRPDIVPGVP